MEITWFLVKELLIPFSRTCFFSKKFNRRNPLKVRFTTFIMKPAIRRAIRGKNHLLFLLFSEFLFGTFSRQNPWLFIRPAPPVRTCHDTCHNLQIGLTDVWHNSIVFFLKLLYSKTWNQLICFLLFHKIHLELNCYIEIKIFFNFAD